MPDAGDLKSGGYAPLLGVCFISSFVQLRKSTDWGWDETAIWSKSISP